MYLGTIYISTKFPLFQLDRNSNMAAILENQLRAIDPKLCTYGPLGKSNSVKILVQCGSSLGHQGARTENTKSAITPELMPGLSPNFYHR
jgi:hypothetical protein